jgi:hypothetical protein
MKKQMLVDIDIGQIEWMKEYKKKYDVPVNAFIRRAIQDRINKLQGQIQKQNDNKSNR